MKNKKVPMRTCIACRECKAKKELLRIVKFNDEFDLDLNGKANGRGAYICDNPKCFDLLEKNKLLNKAYKQNIATEVYSKIRSKYNDAK